MKKKLSFTILFIILLMLPNSVKAACTYSDNTRLQKLASNVGFSYEYYEDGDNIKFKIEVVNLPKELKLRDTTKLKWYYYNGKTITLSNYTPGTSVIFALYAANGNCDGTKLITKYVPLPSYNKYYKNELCKDISNYKLCQKWTNTSTISKEVFEANVKNYKKSLKEKATVKEQEEKTTIEKILIFISKYYIVLFGIPLILSIIGIRRINKKNSFDLE